MSGSGSKDSCGPCGPPGPGWPPAWLAGASDPFGPTGGGGAGAGGERAGDPPERAQSPTPPRASSEHVAPDPVAAAALEESLQANEAEVVCRTDDERLRQAARNLLDDCRAAFARGEHDSALASARHLSGSIPAYLTARGIP